MPHSPARWPPYGRPEPSLLLKVDHYMLDVRIKMRLGGCAASSQNTDVDTGVGVVRRFDPGSVTRGTAVQTSMCIQAGLSHCPMCKVLPAVDGSFVSYKGIEGAFEEP
jgi:hypothetical protein